jgi:hypothetical protein
MTATAAAMATTAATVTTAVAFRCGYIRQRQAQTQHRVRN